jgi:ribosomal protein S18 acetylase RimI-like enzyme
MNETRLLYEILPYRMYAVATLHRALQLRAKWSDAPSMTIFVDGKLEIEGNFDGFANPAIEAGLVHCRALLEFLGLCDKNAVLSNIERRRRGDVGIEHFKNAAGRAEVAFIVIDGYQGQGIGAHLMRHLAGIARQAGLTELIAEVLPENTAMRKVFSKFGFQPAPKREPQVIHLVMPLS